MQKTRPRRASERSLARRDRGARVARACGLALLSLALMASHAGAIEKSSEVAAKKPFEAAMKKPTGNRIEWKFSAGFEYSNGAYGLEEDTEVTYVPVSIVADYALMRFKVTLPFLSIEGPSSVPTDGGTPGTERALGLGQMIMSAGYLWVPSAKQLPFLELTGKLTAPTESSDELGSGEWAFALQGDAFKRFGRITAFGYFGRKFYTGSSINDRFYTSLGSSFKLNDRLSFGVSYDWDQASFDSQQDAHQMIPFAAVKLGSHWSVDPYGVIGLSQGAPDFGVGFSVSFRP